MKQKLVFEDSKKTFEHAKKNGYIPEPNSPSHYYDLRDFAKRSQKHIIKAFKRSKSETIKDELEHALKLLDQIILRNEV